MILSPNDSERFYRIWWPLLKYVNDRAGLVADFPENPKAKGISPQIALTIRDALWESPELLQGFVDENPAGLDEDDLALAASWHRRIAGTFIVMRHLKKHTIFLSDNPTPAAYGVLGITSPLDEVTPYPTPYMVKAVLLPFEGKIIIDGLLIPYSVSFGSGIKKGFTQSLRTATELGGIITLLEPEDEEETKTQAIFDGNRKILAEFRKDLVKAGLSENKANEHLAMVEGFVKTYLLTQNPPLSVLQITAEDLQRYCSKQVQKTNPVSFKRFVKFLLNSDRIDWDTAEGMGQFLKGFK